MRPMAVVPSEVERQLLLESGEAVRNQNQASRALGFERSHAALNHRQAPMLVERPESVLDSPASTTPSKSPRTELFASVGNEVPWSRSRSPKSPLEKSPSRRRGR